MDRRTFLAASAAAPVVAALPTGAFAQARTYTPMPANWLRAASIRRKAWS